jgi:hypothetical protein
MEFQTHRDKDIQTNYSSLKGYINTSYDSLVEKFGKPIPSTKCSDKSDAEWVIEFEDGTVATIYNYKDGFNYCGRHDGTHKKDITDWHIGGFDENARAHVLTAMEMKS